MTMKHVIDGLMKATGSNTLGALQSATGMEKGNVSAVLHGRKSGMRVGKLVEVSRRTGIPAALILAWFMLPADAVMTRDALMEMES